MKTIQELLDDLDAIVDGGHAPKHEVRSQIAFIARQVAAFEADYTSLAESHAQLQQKHPELPPSQPQGTLKPIKVEMLKVLAGTEEAESTLIASRLKLVLAVAQMHILELRDANFIWGNNSGWHITPTGTRYLVDRGHLQ